VFRVRAISGDDVSDPASYAWTVVTPDGSTSDDSGSADDDADDVRGGGTGSGYPPPDGTPRSFRISGDVEGLAPGVERTIVLTLRNPNAEAIYVTAVSVDISADSSPTGCRSASNVELEQPTGITATSPVLVPGHGSVEVETYPRAPRIRFLDQPWNQDVCKDKRFALTYSGSAHS
jgi:hypothetical protein